MARLGDSIHAGLLRTDFSPIRAGGQAFANGISQGVGAIADGIKESKLRERIQQEQDRTLAEETKKYTQIATALGVPKGEASSKSLGELKGYVEGEAMKMTQQKLQAETVAAQAKAQAAQSPAGGPQSYTDPTSGRPFVYYGNQILPAGESAGTPWAPYMQAGRTAGKPLPVAEVAGQPYYAVSGVGLVNQKTGEVISRPGGGTNSVSQYLAGRNAAPQVSPEAKKMQERQGTINAQVEMLRQGDSGTGQWKILPGISDRKAHVKKLIDDYNVEAARLGQPRMEYPPELAAGDNSAARDESLDTDKALDRLFK
ncbi:hypothetical protein [Ruficoccus sp. ZRK36]|uniref:hypothetical protein n=1 Tax=Ruficoccus sp. ZRK36 TaxID=2866311 RepID=UPI001C7316FE|nr:hypothetical protein [Ruficoccus sp. ZRK36]QYY35321.1 hypothetical protein K0V07_13595 [Ruficoccus sp. ZRK36]